MLETYFQEIRRKRTEKRIFWAFVLLSTMILYFFFQGKYLAININLTSLLSFSGQVDSGSGQNYFEFRSFGVINVKTMPRTARISINGQNHTSGEQILTPYGNYHLHVTHPGYLTGSIYFRIDTSQDYYISDIHLLPIPQYRHHQSWSSGTYVTPIGEKSWIVTWSGQMRVFQDTFSGGTLIHTGETMTPHDIGWGRFLSGSQVLRYNILDKRWIAENIAGFADFLEQCEGIAFVQGLFTCKNHHNILTERGMMVRGVQDRGKDWIRTQNAVLLGNTSQDTNDLITLTGAQYTTGSFLYIAKTWYHLHHMSLIPLDTELPSIAVPFDHILSADVFDDEVIIVGIRSGKHYIALFTHRHPENMRLIPFPEEAGTADIRVYRAHKNLFIKTRNALLFLYQGSDVLEWITQGNILLVGDGFGLYEYEGEIWEVYWDARYEKNTW